MFLLGFVTHRLNVSVTGMERASGVQYIPRWTEVAITLAIIAVGFAAFRWIAAYFPIFEEETKSAPLVATALDRDWALAPAPGD